MVVPEESGMSEGIDAAKAAYASGQAAFERGRYREAIAYLEQALAIAKPTTPLGGAIQLWLMDAYVAVDRREDAIALGEKLGLHPDSETRKQARNSLFILQAPPLKRRAEWNSQIPDLGNLKDGGRETNFPSAYAVKPKATPRKPIKPDPEPIDLTQVNTRDNGFLWLVLAGISIVLLTLAWLG